MSPSADSFQLSAVSYGNGATATALRHRLYFRRFAMAAMYSSVVIQLSRGGVPAGCVSIACRYVHTPSEMVDMDDVENAVRLFVAVLEGPIEL